MIEQNRQLKQTKIIATIGPACDAYEVIRDLVESGTDLFRLNASHRSDPKLVAENIKHIRKAADETQKSVAIFLDLQGPKIRVGKFKKGKVELQNGQAFVLGVVPVEGDDTQASVSYDGFVDDVKVGESLYIDDGKIQLVVREKQDKKVLCEVTRGGMLSNHKGINLPHSEIRLAALTEKDKTDLKMAVDHHLDYVALSFVGHASDIKALRKELKTLGAPGMEIIAKIERQSAITNIDSIIDVSDAVMVARGDLGVEIGVEHVPRFQKKIIYEANRRTKPVIVATQMLESMIEAKTATRAEISDIATAIYDFTDAVMLSGETAIGVDPANAVRSMALICEATDKHVGQMKQESINLDKDVFEFKSIATSFCKAADTVAEENNANAIIAFTSSGNTPRIASKMKSEIPIIAPTDNASVYTKMSLYRGVIPMMMPLAFSSIHRWTEMINFAVEEAVKQKLLKTNDIVVVTAGIPIGKSHGINSIRLVTVQ